jgi:hypothetical protein
MLQGFEKLYSVKEAAALRGLPMEMVRSALSRIVYYRIGSRIKIPEPSLPLLVHGPWRKSPTYSSWVNMKSRCLNPNHRAFPRYGGRGITICARWLGKNGFANFLADMGRRPPGKTLDRWPNNDGNYEPGNCRWATASQQIRNTGRLLSNRCKRGHEFTPENTYIKPDGGRVCRECRRQRRL